MINCLPIAQILIRNGPHRLKFPDFYVKRHFAFFVDRYNSYRYFTSTVDSNPPNTLVPVSTLPDSQSPNKPSEKEEVSCDSVDTMKLYSILLKEFTSDQSAALLQVSKSILSEKLTVDTISKKQVETDTQMLKARCHEIRLELQTQASKNATARKAIHERCISEIQATIEKLRDSVDMLQSDTRMRLSLFKSENREDLSKIDSALHQINSLLSLQMSEIKTHTEGVKVRLMFMFTTFLIVAILILILEKNLKKKTGPPAIKDSPSSDEHIFT